MSFLMVPLTLGIGTLTPQDWLDGNKRSAKADLWPVERWLPRRRLEEKKSWNRLSNMYADLRMKFLGCSGGGA
jgi:hypothetical protein